MTKFEPKTKDIFKIMSNVIKNIENKQHTQKQNMKEICSENTNNFHLSLKIPPTLLESLKLEIKFFKYIFFS